MDTIVYVDVFNLYFRLLKDRPELKWVNPKRLAEQALPPQNQIVLVRYFTARVSGRLDPQAPARQQIYFKALCSVPEIRMHMGSFLSVTKFAGLVHPPQFRPSPASPLGEPFPHVVKVHKTEEKGSDVNIASHLLLDAMQDRFDTAVVLSNDSDLTEPIRIASRDLGRNVGLLSPVARPTPGLIQVAKFVRHVEHRHAAAAQFPDPIVLPDGSLIRKPLTWARNPTG